MKFGTARGITRSRVPLLALMALSAAGIAGCAGEGSDGGSGSAGPTGPTGPTTGNGTIAISEADTVITTVTNATVGSDNKVTVTFTLQDSQSRGLAGLQAANVRFTVAKLIPGVNGSQSQWRSYISRVNSPDPKANPVPPATPAAEQKPTEYATYEGGVATVNNVACTPTGVFKSLGGRQLPVHVVEGPARLRVRVVRPVADAARRTAGPRRRDVRAGCELRQAPRADAAQPDHQRRA